MGPVNQPLHLNPLPIVDAVAREFAIDSQEILKVGRDPKLSKPRRMAIYLSRELTSLTYRELAVVFGRTHKALVRAYRDHRQQVLLDAELRQRERAIRRSFR